MCIRECGDRMSKKRLEVYCGKGKGKTTAAIGQALKAASKGKSVFIIQFLKGRELEKVSFIQRLEPEIKLFRFQRREEAFQQLTVQEQEEEIMNMKNGLGFAKKVLATGECDVLILDEVLGLIEYGIASVEDIRLILEEASDDVELIFTGIKVHPEIVEWADGVYRISAVKE